MTDVDVRPAAPGTPLTPEQAAIVEANVALVEWCISRWYPHAQGDDRAEKFADGVFGLMRAVQMWDPAKGTLGTYAPAWIRQRMQHGRGVLEGRNFRSATRIDSRLGEFGAEYRRPLSLDAPLTDRDGQPLTRGDLIPADVDVEAEATSRAHAAHLETLLRRGCRDDTDHAVVSAIAAGHSSEQLAADLGVTVNDARYRRGRLLSRARHPTARPVPAQRANEEPTMPTFDANGFTAADEERPSTGPLTGRAEIRDAVLDYLERHGPVAEDNGHTLGVLAKAVGADPNKLRTCLGDMADKGLIIREIHGKRCRRVELAPGGAALRDSGGGGLRARRAAAGRNGRLRHDGPRCPR